LAYGALRIFWAPNATDCRSRHSEQTLSDPLNVAFSGVIGARDIAIPNRGLQPSLDQGAFGKCAMPRAEDQRVGDRRLVETLVIETLRRPLRADEIAGGSLRLAARHHV
jgi:hypothetical protein